MMMHRTYIEAFLGSRQTGIEIPASPTLKDSSVASLGMPATRERITTLRSRTGVLHAS